MLRGRQGPTQWSGGPTGPQGSRGKDNPGPHKKARDALCPLCESSRQQGTVRLVLALSTPGPLDLAHPAATTPPTTAKQCALGPSRQDCREGLALKLSSLLPSCTPPKTTSHHQPKF